MVDGALEDKEPATDQTAVLDKSSDADEQVAQTQTQPDVLMPRATEPEGRKEPEAAREEEAASTDMAKDGAVPRASDEGGDEGDSEQTDHAKPGDGAGAGESANGIAHSSATPSEKPEDHGGAADEAGHDDASAALLLLGALALALFVASRRQSPAAGPTG